MAAETPFDAKTYEQLQQDLRGALGAIDPRVDCSEGSVVRTLLEAFAHELAVSYEQLRHVYRAGFLDTAEGSALDQVVALLGVERRQGGYLEGKVLVSRQQQAEQRITIPSGTRLTGPPSPSGSPCPVVETTGADRTLEVGATSVLVPVRALEPLPVDEEANLLLEAGRITVMVQPILGIDQVSNPAPLQVLRQPETDDQLRQRTRCWMERVNLGTVAAIEAAVREQGITNVKVLEPVGRPGTVQVVVEGMQAAPDLRQRVQDAVERTRPAGIRVEILDTTLIPIQVTATLVLRENLDANRQANLRSQLQQQINDYISGLGIGETVRASRLRSLLTAPAEVSHLVEPNDPSAPPGPESLLWPTPADPMSPQKVMSDVLIRANHLDGPTGDVRCNDAQRAVSGRLAITLSPQVVDVWVDLTLASSIPFDLASSVVAVALQASLDQAFQHQVTSWTLDVNKLLRTLQTSPLPIANAETPAIQLQAQDIRALTLICPPLQLAQTLVVNGVIVADKATQTMNANDHLRIGQIRKANASPS